MTKFDQTDIDTANDMPAWVETEEKYRDMEEETYNPERFTERQIAYQARTRPFSASWSYVDGDSIGTMPPRPVNSDPILHVQQ